MTRKTPDIKTLMPEGPIGFWPNWKGEDPENGDWVVGVALDGEMRPIALRAGQRPSISMDIAHVEGKTLAKALAAHLQSIRDAGIAP
jgi:hypothetical protein